ncbi:hypothetical protein Ef18B233LT_04350 [Escherichia fergusonii]|nr:hypothetical protein Ef30038_40840 [Escherichia fergusonii]BES07319.1 hypothetical protein Ef18B006LT_04140 [Escherichia fergusonii]BES15174.1 hypothetical protein Ef18B226LT_37530 [Escherichia fergusonii]BES16605.1 hypothetical protein Ef18B233LT_04350 [Escherichia fergusonii]BES21091.1 hypothetical protein Ef18B269LT_04350 [Escherichia fergusonii]
MTGIAGDNLQPVNNIAGMSRNNFFNCVPKMDLILCIIKTSRLRRIISLVNMNSETGAQYGDFLIPAKWL